MFTIIRMKRQILAAVEYLIQSDNIKFYFWQRNAPPHNK